MDDIVEYEKQVYAGVLGKTIGVYMGRPFEQWHRPQIAEKWGIVDRYVHEDQNVPLVVSDDDISGTLTFIRALEDSGLYENTPAEAFGDAWLNYIMDRRTILWWGGYGMSTEHTAYINLRNGIKAPESGASDTNGAPVAEQIGAQIFIDAFGMVCPGNPELAVSLAMRAARVSHDGEAVHAACVVAAMVSAAFIEKDMERLLDIGLGAIPTASTMADVHRDVRKWCQMDGDWEITHARIKEQYGYQNYGGSCHVIPNHALMVMAWAYAPDNFHQAQCIINSAGWDTDCNAANVGSVMGIKVGLDRINEDYEFQRPFGDRLIIPTAEGTRSVSDVANEALHLARIGRHITKMTPRNWPKNGALYHFEMPGSQHGFLAEEDVFSARGTTRVKNTCLPQDAAERGLRITFEDLKKGRECRVSTPILPTGAGAMYGSAQQIQAIPRIFPGNEVIIRGTASANLLTGPATLRMFLRRSRDLHMFFSESLSLRSGASDEIGFVVPDTAWPVQDIGIEISGPGVSGAWYLEGLWISGKPHHTFPNHPELGPGGNPIGWISDVDQVILRAFSSDDQEMMRLGHNSGSGVMVTGNRDWKDYTFETRMNVHLARAAGIIVRYQGLQRHIMLVENDGCLRLIERYYGDSILAQTAIEHEADTFHLLSLQCEGDNFTAFYDGQTILKGQSDRLDSGGAGFLVEQGLVGFRDSSINS